MIPIGRGQSQKAIPDPPFDLGHRRSRGEPEVTELPAGFEAGVNDAAVHRHHLERTDDLVSGAKLGAIAARNGSQLEQVVRRYAFSSYLTVVTIVGSTVMAGEEVTA